jgi:glycosyltransferase involved in cell wall biosynthesis
MFIDVTRLLGRRLKGRLPTGIDRVVQAWVEHWALGRHGPVVGLPHPARLPAPPQALLRIGRWHWVVRPAASRRLFEWLTAPASAATPMPWWSLLQGAPAGWLPKRQVQGRWLVNAGHSGLEHVHWAAPLRAAGAHPLVVVHDLIPITHPQYCRAGEAERHARRMTHALRWSRAIIANSEATLEALHAWATRQGLSVPPATAALLAPGTPLHGDTDPARPPIDRPYFVCLGTWEPRKNHALLLRVWERLVERLGRDAAPRLVLVGQRGWEIEHVERLLDRTPSLHGVVIEETRCSDADLSAWLTHARALLFPSLAEGYGLPLAEALLRRVPVLASDLPVFREVAGDIPEYLDPIDTLGWYGAVRAYLDPQSRRREAQLARLQHFEAPTWNRHFHVAGRLMRQLHQRRGTRPAALPGVATPAPRRAPTDGVAA